MCKHYATADDALAECLHPLVYMQLYDTGYLLYCPANESQIARRSPICYRRTAAPISVS